MQLLTDTVSNPNGIALTNDEKHLLVANSFAKEAYLYDFEIDADGTLKNGRIVHDFTDRIKNNGDIPDGLKIDKKGNIFISGPQGLWILNAAYKAIAHLELPHAISNCWLSEDNKTLFITGSDKILRLKLK